LGSGSRTLPQLPGRDIKWAADFDILPLSPLIDHFFIFFVEYNLSCTTRLLARLLIEGIVTRSIQPQPVQHHSEFARHGNHGTLLRILSAALGQLKTKLPQFALGTERTEDILGAPDQQAS
jgi:hypothetical protein